MNAEQNRLDEQPFPTLISDTNRRRSREEMEYELLDTSVGYQTRLTWKLKMFSLVVNGSSVVSRERVRIYKAV